MLSTKTIVVTFALSVSAAGCVTKGELTTEQLAVIYKDTSLKERYQRQFLVGAAVDSNFRDYENILKEHFSSITAENEMKFESLQSSEGSFSFSTADNIVNFALENGMVVRGHALIWHRQTPSWVFEDPAGNAAGEELLLERMEDHISTVMSHYRGKVGIWDVVNEAINPDGSYRTGDEIADDQKSPWFAILGKRYIKEAFLMAHEADPNVKLFYNDYYNYLPEKQNGIYEMLKELLNEGVPVHGVGLQCHLNIEASPNPEHQSYHQSPRNLERAIELYASLGLEVHVTELDLSVYIGGNQYDPEDFYTVSTFDRDVQEQQAWRYAAFFELFRKHKGTITSVSFWGVADDNTWLSELSSGRADFPLLFDTEHQPKPAFYRLLDF